VREVLAYWGQDILSIVVGALGAAASCLLLVSGVALAAHRPSGRSMVMAGAVSMIAVHLIGLVLGIVGYGGALLGVAYPLLLLVVLRARPKLGATMNAADGDLQSGERPPTNQAHRREAVSVA